MLNVVAREGLTEMAIPEQRLGKGEGVGSEDRVQQVLSCLEDLRGDRAG